MVKMNEKYSKIKIGILNSGGYNVNSIRFALERLGQNDISIVKNKSEFDICDKIIIPGVGNAKVAMEIAIIATEIKTFFITIIL